MPRGSPCWVVISLRLVADHVLVDIEYAGLLSHLMSCFIHRGSLVVVEEADEWLFGLHR